MLETNDRLQDRYEILRPLGAGGMAEVYLARDTRLGGRLVAIKVMNPARLAVGDTKWATEAFHQEAQVLARLNHPGIARVTDFFEHDGLLYLVMEFVAGETMEAALERAPQGFAQAQVLLWAADLVDVLSYLHSQNPPVIFRDLKPSNVMVRPDGSLKLIDFGIARYFKPGQTVDTLRLGTPGYVAPEGYGQEQTNARSDVYSLGVLLHQLFSGHDPGTTPMNLPPLRELAPALSPRVLQAVDRATAVESAQRFATVQEFGATLGIFEPSLPATDPAERAGSKRRIMWVALATIAVLLAAGLAWAAMKEDAADTSGEPVPPRVVSTRSQVSEQAVAGRGEEQLASVPAEEATGTRSTETDTEEDGEANVVEPADSSPDPDQPVAESPTTDATDATETHTLTATATVTPTPSATPFPTQTNTPVPTNTPFPTATARPLPVATAAPTRCGTSVNSSFSSRYDSSLGCPLHGGRSTYTALENFERGYMIWREDTDEIYAIYNGGTWSRFGDLFAETMPNYSCGVEQSPPTPRRGFGMIWCQYNYVQQGLGNATNPEWGSTSTAQDFANGSIIRTDMGTFVLYDNGTWR